MVLLFFFHLILITNNNKKEYEEPCADCVVSRERERPGPRRRNVVLSSNLFLFLARGPKKLNRHIHTTVENFDHGPHTRFAADCVFSLPHPFIFHPSTIHYNYFFPSRDCRRPMSFWVFDLVLGNDGMFDSLVVVFPCSKLGRIMMMILVTTWTS